MIKKIKAWAKKLKLDIRALQIALAENLVSWHVKLLIIFTLGYAFSPIDLIPDFIPVIGLLDDLIILPFLIYLILKLVPKSTMDYCRHQAENRPHQQSTNWIAGIIVVAIWLVITFWLFYQFFPEQLTL